MKIIGCIFFVLVLSACDDFNNSKEKRLAQIESKSYSGFVMHTKYGYDKQGRITTITQYKDNEDPVVAVTVTYNGQDAVLIGTPNFDPGFNQTTKVILTLNKGRLAEKRIEYTHKVPTSNNLQQYATFIYDTLVYEYDALGFLTKTKGSRYDSSWITPTYNTVRRSTSNATYTVVSGNVTASDELVDYPTTTTDGGTITLSGGSSEYHNEFSYSKSYPNKTDFKNAAILNEYKQHFEAFLNSHYKNMPNQVTRTFIDRDLNGAIIFNIKVNYDMVRGYNNDGLLSSIRIPENTQYTEVNYFYK